MKELPKKIPEQRYEAMLLLAKKSMTVAEMVQNLPEHLKAHFPKQISNYEQYGFIKRVDNNSRPLVYMITAYGKHCLKNVDKIEIVPYANRPAAGRGARKPKPKPPVQAAPKPLNISPLGDQFSNLAADLLQQNEAYRDLLLKLYDTIGNALELNDKKETES